MYTIMDFPPVSIHIAEPTERYAQKQRVRVCMIRWRVHIKIAACCHLIMALFSRLDGDRLAAGAEGSLISS